MRTEYVYKYDIEYSSNGNDIKSLIAIIIGNPLKSKSSITEREIDILSDQYYRSGIPETDALYCQDIDLIVERFRSIDNFIYQRLKKLRLYDYEDDEDENMSFDSLLAFYRFCLKNNMISYPAIVLDSNGYICIEWYNAEGKIVLGIDFIKNDYVSYAIFIKNTNVFGIDKLDDMYSIIALKGINNLFSNN